MSILRNQGAHCNRKFNFQKLVFSILLSVKLVTDLFIQHGWMISIVWISQTLFLEMRSFRRKTILERLLESVRVFCKSKFSALLSVCNRVEKSAGKFDS